MQASPSRRRSSSCSAITRATIRPTVSQPILRQARDRRLGHLLGQPGDDVLKVARVTRARPRPRHRLEPNTAITAAEPAQLALDDAAVRAEIQVPPALDAAVVDLQPPAGLAAPGADPSPAAKPDNHDHPLGAEADVDHGCPGQAEQPLECGADAHVALLREPLTFEQPAACAESGGASLAFCATSENFSNRRARLKRAPNAALQTAASPTSREETRCSLAAPRCTGGLPASSGGCCQIPANCRSTLPSPSKTPPCATPSSRASPGARIPT